MDVVDVGRMGETSIHEAVVQNDNLWFKLFYILISVKISYVKSIKKMHTSS